MKRQQTLAHEADARARMPAAQINQAHALGLAYYGVDQAQGGLAGEHTTLTCALMAEALARGDFSLAACLLAPLSTANCIRRWGSAAQQAAWLPSFVAEQPAPRMAIAVAEPRPLFDPGTLRARTRRRPGGYVLDGEKCLVLDGLEASHFLVAAVAEDGPVLFLLEAGRKGVTLRAEPAMGLRACATARVRLDGVKVPLEQRLSGSGFDYRRFLDLGDLAWCALALGTCQAALDYVTLYCNERQAFGEPISRRQGAAFMVADIAIELDAMRLMVWRACSRADQGREFAREAYLARLLYTEKAMKIGSDAVRLLGGHGFTQEHPVERWYRDLRSVAVLAGGLHL